MREMASLDGHERFARCFDAIAERPGEARGRGEVLAEATFGTHGSHSQLRVAISLNIGASTPDIHA